jgi:hypothetical protein
MPLSPSGHQAKNWPETFSMFRERIFNAGGYLGIDFAVDDGVSLQFSQLLRQHLLGWPGKELLQFAETPNPSLQVIQDRRLPFPANDVGCAGDRAIERVHLESLLTLGTKKVPTSKKDTLT